VAGRAVRLIAGAAAVLAVGCAGRPKAARPVTGMSGADDGRPAFALTIYSNADPATFDPQEPVRDQLESGAPNMITPGYGVVREVRSVELAGGVSRLEFPDVAAGIDPTTVTFRSLTAPDSTAVLEQNFEYDLTSAAKLLQKHLGREVVVFRRRENDGEGDATPVRGRLMSFTGGLGQGGSLVLVTDDPRTPVVVQSAEGVESIRLAGDTQGGSRHGPDTDLVIRPTLNWKVKADRPGRHDVEVSYQTDGLTWRADYNLVLSRDDTAADLSAWVTLLNGSGMSYPDARLKLVAGKVQRLGASEWQERAGRGLFGGRGGDDGLEEKGFFEFHLYTLGRPTSLPDQSIKQIELFPPKGGVKVSKQFVYYGPTPQRPRDNSDGPVTDPAYGSESPEGVGVYLQLTNDAQSGLGIPLPAGRVRIYKVDDADRAAEFVGDDVIDHTPCNEQVRLYAGTAFDLVGERKQTDFDRDGDSITESFEVTLRNRKDVPVRVTVDETLYRWSRWEVTASSHPFEKEDSRTIHIPVDVPAGGERKVTYTAKYAWGSEAEESDAAD
jgi:hypothetical protein